MFRKLMVCSALLFALLVGNSRAYSEGVKFTPMLTVEQVFAGIWNPQAKLHQIAVAVVDGGLDVYDTSTGKRLSHLSDEEVWGEGMGAPRAMMTWSPDGRLLAARMDTGDRVVVFDVSTGKQRYEVTWDLGSPVAFSPDGKWLAGIKPDGAILLWDAETGELKMTLPTTRTSQQSVTVLVWSADNTQILYGKAKDKDVVGVSLVDVSTGKPVFTVPAPGNRLTVAGWLRDQGTIFAVDNYGCLNVWDAKTGKAGEQKCLGGSVLDFSPDGNLIAVNSEPQGSNMASSKVVNLYDATTFEQVSQIELEDAVSWLGWDASGDALATVMREKQILQVWEKAK